MAGQTAGWRHLSPDHSQTVRWRFRDYNNSTHPGLVLASVSFHCEYGNYKMKTFSIDINECDGDGENDNDYDNSDD